MRYYVNEGSSAYSPAVSQCDDELHWFQTDGAGSTVGLTDETGSQTDTFLYEGFGTSLGRTGTTATPYQYVGGYGYFREPDVHLTNAPMGAWFDVTLPASLATGWPRRLPPPLLDYRDALVPLECWTVATTVRDEVDSLPFVGPWENERDKLQHCLAGCLIAREAGYSCGIAIMVGDEMGKERVWSDHMAHLRADLTGINCSRHPCFSAQDALGSCTLCCHDRGYGLGYPLFLPGVPDLPIYA